jgi:hypothetical protein
VNQSVIQLFPPKAVFLLVHAFFFYFRVLHYINFGDWVFTSRGPYSLRPLGRLVAAWPGTSSWLFGPGVAALGHKAGGRGASLIIGPCSTPLDERSGELGPFQNILRLWHSLRGPCRGGGWLQFILEGCGFGTSSARSGWLLLSRVGLALLPYGMKLAVLRYQEEAAAWHSVSRPRACYRVGFRSLVAGLGLPATRRGRAAWLGPSTRVRPYCTAPRTGWAGCFPLCHRGLALFSHALWVGLAALVSRSQSGCGCPTLGLRLGTLRSLAGA